MSVRLGQLGSHWTDFHEIWYLSFFLNLPEKFILSRTSINGNLHEDQYRLFITSLLVLLKMGNV